MELGSEAPNSDPYKMSLHSIRKEFQPSSTGHKFQPNSTNNFQSSGPTSRFN